MSYAESMWNHADIDVPLDRIKPTGDCVLVRVLPEEEVTASGIVFPNMGKDSAELLIGEVVAAGPGDRVFVWVCNNCAKIWDFDGEPMHLSKKSIKAFRDSKWRIGKLTTSKGPGKCEDCGGSNWELYGIGHHHMHVKPGDRIWYRRVLANQQLINGELFQIIREEQHIWAVLEN